MRLAALHALVHGERAGSVQVASHIPRPTRVGYWQAPSAIACHAARLCQGVKTIDWPPQHNSTILYQDALRAQTAAVVIVHMRV